MTDLLPCPFCGGGAAHGLWGDRRMAVHCFRCDAGGPTTEVVPEVCIEIRPFIEQAIAAWNRRAAPARPADATTGASEAEQRALRENLTRIMNWFDERFRADFPHAPIRSAEASTIEDAILALEHVPWKLNTEQSEAFARALGREPARLPDSPSTTQDEPEGSGSSRTNRGGTAPSDPKSDGLCKSEAGAA